MAINSKYLMGSCNHEETDYKIAVHVLHALENGYKVIQIRTVDTDIMSYLSVYSINLSISNHVLRSGLNWDG